ncbi:helix-turn-helix domain-containing protein [Nocardia flavorosea]|uniref:helix-turn-helix domain-containing protein n=1 Tax=Nocardia flavorosea TaxID=53429 RepID=UPI0018933B01|nr:helix-turn-helix transcriptional regulator [Nocardia flavorosea]MBF6351508.1 helix-turn-helix domain-containing protein [Nocardia flavorosea]
MAREDQPGSTLPRRQLGRALREARQGMGFTLEQAAQEMEMSKTSIIRIEKGHNEKVKLRDVESFGLLYELGEEQIAELKTLAQQSATKSWWIGDRHLIKTGFNTYLGLESSVERLYFYQPMIVPGLLEVVEYARAFEAPYFPSDSSEDVERRIALRMRRASILTRRRNPVTAEFLVHESVIHTRVGTQVTMASQLRHIADMSTLANVHVRILPFSAGFPGKIRPVLPYTIMEFPTDRTEFGAEPPVVYVEGTTSTTFFEDQADVRQYRQIHASLRDASLDERQSRDLLRQVARRYEQ